MNKQVSYRIDNVEGVKDSMNNRIKTLLASRNALFLLFTLPSVGFAAVSIIDYIAFLVGPPFLGILGEAFGIGNALLAVLLFVILSGIVSSVMRENASS